jgi:DNA polymerase-1
MIDENAYDAKQGGPLALPSLENCCKYFLGKPGKVKSPIFLALMSLYGWAGISPKEMREYAEADAVAAYELWEALAKRLQNEKGAENIKYWKDLEMPNFKSVYAMKTLGVAVDVDFCKEWEDRCDREMYKLRQTLGFDPAKPTELAPFIYEELGLPVIMKKRKGKEETPTLDKDAMEQYEKMLEYLDNPIARQIIEYRGWGKSLSSYYRPYQNLIDPDGRLRPEFKNHGTLNGRYACSSPNLQQIPKTDEDLILKKPWSARVKECFIPMEGYELWEFDYSQLELRLGAAMGMDRKLLEVFNDPNERDIFTEMALEMQWPRQQVKSFVYSIDYGAGAGRVSDIFNVSKERAAQYIEEFYATYSGLGRANDKAKYEASTTGKLRYWSGHYRHFKSSNEAYKAFNSKIQGGSADLVKKVMNRITRELPEVRMLLQVHDALWFELPTGMVEYYKERIKAIMEDPFDGDKTVVFKVDGHRVGGQDRYARAA